MFVNTLFPNSSHPFLPSYTLRPLPPLVSGLTDFQLSLIVPLISFWITCLFFEILDRYGLFQQYKLHTSGEEKTRNRVSFTECFRGVVINQIVQTGLGLALSLLVGGDGEFYGKEEYDVAAWALRVQAARRSLPRLISLTGLDAWTIAKKVSSAEIPLLAAAGNGADFPLPFDMRLAYAIYWYIYPVVQFAVAFAVVDTWQYFGHRWLHENKWAYKNIHSVHHSMYIPYHIGGQYTHPLEGLLLDTVSASLAIPCAGLSNRGTMCFLAFLTFNNVVLHAGFYFPKNPFKLITDNDVYFHDIHHQRWGMKHNFGVPWSFWDRVMGTYWHDQQTAAKLYEHGRVAAEHKLNQEKKMETGSKAL